MIAIATANRRIRVAVKIGDTQQLPPPRPTYLTNELESVLNKSVLEKLLVKDIVGRYCAEFNINYKSHVDIVVSFNQHMYDNSIRASHRSTNRLPHTSSN